MRKKTLIMDILLLVLGCAATAFGLAVFTIPNRIAPGGLSGVATALAFMFDLPVGALTLILNVPLLAIALRRLGLRPLIKTLVGTVLLSLLIDFFAAAIAPYTQNQLFAALLGGVLTGAGMGLLLVRGISTGGTDLIGLMLFKSKPTLSMGQLLMLIDTVVVVFATIVFRDVEVALYSIFTIAVVSKTIDAIQAGIDHAKVIYIVTDKGDAIVDILAGQMGRGVTVLNAKGGFTGDNKTMLMTIARRGDIFTILSTVREKDPGAFTILCDATAVYGEGFKETITNAKK